MVKHTQTIRRKQATNCFSVFDHLMGLALKRVSWVAVENNNEKNKVASRDDVRVFLINFVQVLLTQSEAHCLEEMARRCFVKMVLL